MKLSFLPTQPPAQTYSKYSSKSLDRLQDIASNLPKLLLTGRVQSTIDSLSINDLSVNELFIEKRIKILN